jgi:hypothetical protein
LEAGEEARVSKGWQVVAAAVLCIALWAPAAAGEVISVAGRALTVNPIAGYCPLDKTRDVEKRVYSTVESAIRAQDELLAYWVDCKALSDFRAGASAHLAPYILIMASRKHDRVFQTWVSREGFLDGTYEQLTTAFGREKFLADPSSEKQEQANKTIADFAANSQVGERKVMGVMGRDDDGVYFALIQRIAADQQGKPMAGVTGMTKVKRFVLSAAAYDLHADAQTFLALKDRAAAAVRSLIAANLTDE